jgi:hypothetical protein
MVLRPEGHPVQYVLSERRFTGTDAEVLQQLDELIEGLVAFRHWLAPEPSPPTPKRVRRRFRWRLKLFA